MPSLRNCLTARESERRLSALSEFLSELRIVTFLQGFFRDAECVRFAVVLHQQSHKCDAVRKRPFTEILKFLSELLGHPFVDLIKPHNLCKSAVWVDVLSTEAILLRFDKGRFGHMEHLLGRGWLVGVEPHEEVRCFGLFLERLVDCRKIMEILDDLSFAICFANSFRCLIPDALQFLQRRRIDVAELDPIDQGERKSNAVKVL